MAYVSLVRQDIIQCLALASVSKGASAKSDAMQGAAFKDIPEGTYYAAASLFTAPKPEKMASLTFNFGPDFKFGPPAEPDLPLAKPFCDIQPPPAPVPDSNGCITVDKAVAAIVSEPAE